MKIALLGAGGQLAFDLKKELGHHEILPLTRRELDICDMDQAEEVLGQLDPDVVINTAANNLVDRAEEEPAETFETNSLGPHVLAKICARQDRVLLHFSTDYVFGLDSDHHEPWLETDPPGPISVYGTSKLAGEHLVRSTCRKHFVVRTCGLYGVKGSRGKGGNFVETMLRLAAHGKTVRVVADQTCTPSYTQDVARVAADLIRTDAYGLYHITNAGACSWYELAGEIFRQSELAVDCQPISSEEFAATARRPFYSVLSNQKIKGAGITPAPDWHDALERYLLARRAARNNAK